jgi:hypothetical protein
MTRVAPSGAGADTLQASPIAGAVLTRHWSVLVDGAARSSYGGEVVARTDGSFEFPDVPGGYYLLRGTVADGAWAGSSTLSYVHANAPRVTVDVRFWQRS